MGAKVVPLRIVLDTNVLLSALLFGGEPGTLYDLWVGQRIVPLVSKATFREFRRVLAYPKFRLSPAEITMLIEDEVLPYAEVVEVADASLQVGRDPHDDKFLALAATAGASYLVTGDRDLLALQAFGCVKIVTVREILGLLRPPLLQN